MMGFPDGSAGKESTCNADQTWVRSLGRVIMLSFGSYIAVLSFSFNTLNEIHINKMQVKIILT